MHALIKLKNGKTYVSAVFGAYKDKNSKQTYAGYTLHYIVFDQAKKKLIKQYVYDQKALKGKGGIIRQVVLDVESSMDNWVFASDGSGHVNFLDDNDIKNVLSGQALPDDIICQCKLLDDSYEYKEWNEVNTLKDIEDLAYVSGGFHDAIIETLEQKPDGSLCVLFDGIWGCKLEVIFEGDVHYCVDCRNPKTCDPYWFGSTILIDGEYKVLADDEGLKPEDIDDNYCYFKAKKMRYHVIPD